MNNKTTNYFSIASGNNCSAIKAALLKRGVWSQLPPEKEYIQASFHWQQLNYSHKKYEDFCELSRNYPSKHYFLNHFENNSVITTKSGLVKTLKYFYSHEGAPLSKHIFEAVPTSFIVKAHKDTVEYRDFIEKFEQIEKKQFNREKIPQKHCEQNIWFIKPESDNQGKGIILSNNLKQIESFLVSKPVNSGWVIQKAIQKPFLYNNRKFDIRAWVLVTPQFEVYYYNAPYIRTSSTEYDMESLNSQIHLTNNCQQKNFTEYAKYEEGNTLPFQRLREYLLEKPEFKEGADLIMDKILERMKEMIIDTMMCAKKHFQKNSRKTQFQLFGYDFLIDEDFRAWILEVNNNPYLGTPSTFMRQMMPQMIDEMMEIIVDPYFPPENYCPVATKRFELLTKERTNFRIGSITSRNSTTNSIELKRSGFFNNDIKEGLFPNDKFASTASNSVIRTSLYQSSLSKVDKKQRLNTGGVNPQKDKFRYSTPSESLRYLLDNYCYVDLDPFQTPVNLILTSDRLADSALEEANLKTLKMITETRVASILIEEKFLEVCKKILLGAQYPQSIKIAIIKGYENAAKDFKGKLFAIQKVVPIIAQLLSRSLEQIGRGIVEQVIKLQIKLGGFLEKVFIPGVTTQNQKLRRYFIKSNCFSLLLFLMNSYPEVCKEELEAFMGNMSHKDWDLFYDQGKNKGRRAYSPRSVSALIKQKDSSFNINLHEITATGQENQTPDSFQKSKNFESVHSNGSDNGNKSFRTRRHSAFPLLKK